MLKNMFCGFLIFIIICGTIFEVFDLAFCSFIEENKIEAQPF